MKAFIFLFSLIFLSACSEYSRKNFKSGGVMNGTANDSSYTIINFRVKPASLTFLNQLKGSDFLAIPASWPLHELSKIKEAFKFLYREPTTEFKSVNSTTIDENIQFSFTTFSDEDFVIRSDKDVSHLNWANAQGLPVEMNKIGVDTWQINVDGEFLSWNARTTIICYMNSCREISLGLE